MLCCLDIVYNYVFKKTFKILFIYLFIFGYSGSLLLPELYSSCGEQGLLSSCGVRASHCSGFSRCGAQALGTCASVAEAHGL